MIQTRPALEQRRPDHGYRILIDPVWPAGLAKGKAAGLDWTKSLYPSRNLQDWMRRNPRKIEGFRTRYLLELATKEDEVAKVSRMLKERGTVTILVPESNDKWGIYETLLAYLQSACD